MNFLIHYIYEIASRENNYAGRLRFSGSLCLRVQRNAMSIDYVLPGDSPDLTPQTANTLLNRIACVSVIRRQPQLT